jgi:hypothetical protein
MKCSSLFKNIHGDTKFAHKPNYYITYVLRRFVFELHVSVRWGNTLLGSVTCHDDT